MLLENSTTINSNINIHNLELQKQDFIVLPFVLGDT